VNTIIDDFIYQMFCRGIETNESIIADGRIRRFHVLGDRKGTKNGWYNLHADFPPVGVFGCWKRYTKMKWQPNNVSSLSLADQRTLRERKQNIEGQYVHEFKSQVEALRELSEIWQNAKPAYNRHGYLDSKGVCSHGLRYSQGALLVPVTDIDGGFHGLQKIWSNGKKYFCKGTIKTGNFHVLGEPRSDNILVCEGYSTGATLHEISRQTVVVAFDCGNLRLVAENIVKGWPSSKIVICADDDHTNPENPGIKAATEASIAVNGKLIVPKFPNDRGRGNTDFNDLYRLAGKTAVLACLAEIGGSHVQNV